MESSLRILCLVSFLTVFVKSCSCDSPEHGIFNVTLNENDRFSGVSKNLAEKTEIAITVDCNGKGRFAIEWVVRYTECNGLTMDNTTHFISSLFEPNRDLKETGDLGLMYDVEDYIAVQRNNGSNELNCETPHLLLQDESDYSYTCYSTYKIQHCQYRGELTPTTETPATASEAPAAAPAPGDKGKSSSEVKRRDTDGQKERRDADKNPKTEDADKNPKTAATKPSGTPSPAVTPKPAAPTESATPQKPLKGRVTKTNERAGRYWVLVHLKPLGTLDPTFKVTLTITMKSPSGFLSAYQAPLLVFYGVMCGAYSILTFIWLILLAMQWRDLLRIQFWIGGVMLLGLLEKAVFYAEYENINNYGMSVPGAIIMAELISCFKRALARMLVVIVCLGYGITRPRLGKDLHWVLGVGMLYFIMSSVEACLRVKGTDQNDMIAILPLSVLDAIICWWIFKSLVDTTRTLRLRRNMAKLWLYRHFTNTLIFCVVAAFVFLLWSMRVHRWTDCMKKWNELWLDDAYWHVLFCVILVVIVILFRPTANNQRYAYSPLTDREGDDESQEPMLNDAFEGMKMRNVVSNRNESQTSNRTDDDLKWVEDNIPAAVADAALGAFDDSEEELVTNLERSKME